VALHEQAHMGFNAANLFAAWINGVDQYKLLLAHFIKIKAVVKAC
jgi:hypothetical protein